MAVLNPANVMCNRIHDVVQSSGLHFVINQTPHSSYITIRRKFICPETIVSENLADAAWRKKVDELEKLVEILETDKSALEEICVVKDEEALICQHESEKRLVNLHAFTDKLSAENENLKEQIATLNHEIGETKVKLSKTNKLLKSNEKEIYKLGTNIENCQDTIKNLKGEKVLLTNGKAKAEADLKKMEKKASKSAKKQSVTTQTTIFSKSNSTSLVTTACLNSSHLISKPSLETSSTSRELVYQTSTDRNTCNELFSEFDAIAIAHEPKTELEIDDELKTVLNVPVKNLFDTLAIDTKEVKVQAIMKISGEEKAELENKLRVWKCELCEQTYPMGYTMDQAIHRREHLKET